MHSLGKSSLAALPTRAMEPLRLKRAGCPGLGLSLFLALSSPWPCS